MEDHALKPEKITKPIQLLGAWLAGLLAIDSCFLIAVTKMPAGSWESGALTVAAIFNVPLFLLAVFLLQTKFRPELQEDSYYSTYLNRKTNELVSVTKEDAQISQIRQRLVELENKITSTAPEEVAPSAHLALAELRIGVNRHLADRSHIGAKLAEFGVFGFSSFGAEEAPDQRLVAVSEYLSKERLSGVLQVAKELGFSGYTLFDNLAEDTEEDVLFGAYGMAEYEIASEA